MFLPSQIAAVVVAGLFTDPGMALFDELGLSFSEEYAPAELIAKVGARARCAVSTPGTTSCRTTERIGAIEAGVVITIAHGTHEAFVETVGLLVEDAPPGLADLFARGLALRYDPVVRSEREWCANDRVISVAGGGKAAEQPLFGVMPSRRSNPDTVGGATVSVWHWNLFRRDRALCRDGRIVKMVPYTIEGGSSQIPVFLGLGREVRWEVDADAFHDKNPEYATWTSARGKGRGLTAEMDVMLRAAEVTWFFGSIADTLSEVQVRWRGVSRPFKERVIDQARELFRYHASFEQENGVVVKGRLCKEDLHLSIDDGPDGFTVGLQHNPDGFCVD